MDLTGGCSCAQLGSGGRRGSHCQRRSQERQLASHGELGFAISAPPRPSEADLTRVLQECVSELHIGPYGMLFPCVGANGELLLVRRRAGNVLDKLRVFPIYYELGCTFLAGNGAGPSVHTLTCYNRMRHLVDGHGRMLLLSTSLLRQLLLPTARYPIQGTASAARNRLRIVRVLRSLTGPGELCGFPVPTGPEEDDTAALDFIGRLSRLCLWDMRVHIIGGMATVPRSVLGGCIYFMMSTEVEGDTLAILWRLFLSYLCSPNDCGRGAVRACVVAARSRVLLDDPAVCLIPCTGLPLVYSCRLSFGSFFLPTTGAPYSAYQGANTPYFELGTRCHSRGGCPSHSPGTSGPAVSRKPYLIMLLTIDSEGGLLNFAYASPPQGDGRRDGEEGESCEVVKGTRCVEGRWSEAEQEEVQWEGARMLYEWAWTHGVSVIVTSSHAPPVIKTFGQRYSAECSAVGGGSRCSPVFMVDQIDAHVLDAMLRRLQYRYYVSSSVDNTGSNGMSARPTTAILRRGRLQLPDREEDALLPCCYIAHGDLETLAAPTSLTMKPHQRDGAAVRGVFLQMDPEFFRAACCGPEGIAPGEGAGAMLLASPSSHHRRSHTALLMKCAEYTLLAVDPSSAPRCRAAECGLGVARAGGAQEIVMARHMRRNAEAIRQGIMPVHHNPGRSAAQEDAPVLAAVLDIISEALLEVPRRIASYVSSHHTPLRHAWLRLERDELQKRCGGSRCSLMLEQDASPLHVYIREDPSFYSRCMSLAQNDGDLGRRYFCASDTESSGSDGSDDEAGYSSTGSGLRRVVDMREESTTLSFVEPVAVTTGVVRAAVTFVRLVLSNASSTEVSI